MSREELPILVYENNTLFVRGRVDRILAHKPGFPIAHATAVVWAMTPDRRFVLADKYPKKNQKEILEKGRALPEKVILDCFGGHMRYEDIPLCELEKGLSQKTYAACGMRELSEELWLLQEDESYVKIPLDQNKLIPIGFYPYKNEHNKEYTWAFIYPLAQTEGYVSMDTIAGYEKEYEISQPILYRSLEQMIDLYENPKENICFSDGISRILYAEKKSKYQRLKSLCQNLFP